jgi:hypothetical protein
VKGPGLFLLSRFVPSVVHRCQVAMTCMLKGYIGFGVRNQLGSSAQ